MKQIIIFDYDGTITQKDSSKAWIMSLIQCNPFILLKCGRQLVSSIFLYFFTKDKHVLKNKLFYHLMSCYNHETIDAPASLFSKKMRNNFREPILDLLFHYVANNYDVIVATASSKIAVRKSMQDIGLDLHVLGYEVVDYDYNNGRAESFLACYGDEKASHIVDHLQHLNQSYEIIKCFSDDLVDLPMMQLGKSCVWVVGSDTTLQEIIDYDPNANFVDCRVKGEK